MDKIVKVFTRANAKHWLVNVEKILIFSWQNSDKDLKVTVEEDSDGRSIRQNKLMWKWHSELSEHIKETQGGVFSPEVIHLYVVKELLPMQVIETPEYPEVIRTETKKLNVKPMANFLTSYEMWAADKYQCQFTRPEDLYMKAVMKDD